MAMASEDKAREVKQILKKFITHTKFQSRVQLEQGSQQTTEAVDESELDARGSCKLPCSRLRVR